MVLGLHEGDTEKLVGDLLVKTDLHFQVTMNFSKGKAWKEEQI